MITVSDRKPWAWTLPHSAPSVAISTGSGLTFRAAMPSFSRCAVQACLIGEVTVGMFGEAGDHMAGQRAFAHIGERVVIDDVIAMAGAQQAREN